MVLCYFTHTVPVGTPHHYLACLMPVAFFRCCRLVCSRYDRQAAQKVFEHATKATASGPGTRAHLVLRSLVGDLLGILHSSDHCTTISQRRTLAKPSWPKQMLYSVLLPILPVGLERRSSPHRRRKRINVVRWISLIPLPILHSTVLYPGKRKVVCHHKQPQLPS